MPSSAGDPALLPTLIAEANLETQRAREPPGGA
jgi:hypothetical protein